MKRSLRLALFTLVAFVLPSAPHLRAQGAAQGGWRLRAAIVVSDLEVRSVPLLAFRLLGQPDTTLIITGRTNLDGISEGEAPAGSYFLVGDAPVRVNGMAYSWRVPLTITPGEVVVLELTNANATIDSTPVPEPARLGWNIEDAADAYPRARRGVVRVETSQGSATGFLVDSAAGLVVTTAFAVEGEVRVSAVLDSVTRVAAVVLARSTEADVAVLRLSPNAVQDRPSLALADPGAAVGEGARVFAVGYPLEEELVLTTGVVSASHDGLVISDVTINAEIAGGPLLDGDGHVVGINAYEESSPDGGEPLSGAIAAARIRPILDSARAVMAGHLPPPETHLPTMPLGKYPMDSLAARVARLPDGYLDYFTTDANGRFDITLTTPVTLAFALRHPDGQAESGHVESNADSLEAQYGDVAAWWDWERLGGKPLTPVVEVVVTPRTGETTGSAVTRSLLTQLFEQDTWERTYKYSGDVKQVRIFRNGVLVTPIRGGTPPVEMYQHEDTTSKKVKSHMGAYLVDPLVFAPDTLGTPPSIVIEVRDFKHPKEPSCRELSREAAAFTWNDFRPYLASLAPELAATRADPDRKPARFTASRVPGDSVVTTDPRKTWRKYWPACPSVVD